MSLRRHLLNRWLRQVERPRLAQAQSPEALRQDFERKARLLFRPARHLVQREITLRGEVASVPAVEIAPPRCQPDHAILYFHGGGFVFGSPETHAAMAGEIALRTGVRVILPRYRRAPEHRFPAAADDALCAWQGMLAAEWMPRNIVLGGDSAGGHLAFGLLAHLCAAGAPRPAAGFGFSPLAALDEHGPSFDANRRHDVLLPAERARDMRRMYLGEAPVADPRLDLGRADFTGAPPVWLSVARTEILRDDARDLAAALRRGGSDVTLVEVDDLPHVWPLFHNYLPEARQTLDDLGQWVNRCPGWASES